MVNSSIHIFSQSKIQKDLLISFLRKENMGWRCEGTTCTRDEIFSRVADFNHDQLILMDCLRDDFEVLLENLKIGILNNSGRSFMALFNVHINPKKEEDQKETLEVEAVRQGIRGIFYCQDSLNIISKGIQKMLNGEYWVSRGSLSGFVSNTIFRKSNQNELSVKEEEILRWVAGGYSNDQIAELQHIAPNTVKTHIHRIYKKIGISGNQHGLKKRVAAMLWAKKNL